MTPADWSIAATVLGFVGSLMLFYPGWRASRSLQHMERIRTLIDKANSAAGSPITQRQADGEHTDPGRQSIEPNDAPETAAEQIFAVSDPGHELLHIMKEQHQSWSRLEHGLLMAGVLLIFLSFAAELFLVKLAS